MRHSRHHVWGVVLAVALSCTIAACKSEPRTTVEAGQSVVRIAERLISVVSDTDIEVALQESISACMRERGFEYTPHVRTAVIDLPNPDGGSSVWVPVEDRRPFMESYGYGRSTLYWGWELQAARARGVDADPNERRMAAMSDAERKAYEDAMLGPVVGGAPSTEGGTIVERDRSHSCVQRGLETAERLDLDRLPTDAQDALDSVLDRLANDPEVRAVEEAWSRCMAEAGYRLPGRSGGASGFPTGLVLVERLMDRLNESAIWKTELVRLGDGSTYHFDYPVYDAAAVGRVQQAELSIASADIECDERHERSSTLVEARLRITEEVVAEHLTSFLEMDSDRV